MVVAGGAGRVLGAVAPEGQAAVRGWEGRGWGWGGRTLSCAACVAPDCHNQHARGGTRHGTCAPSGRGVWQEGVNARHCRPLLPGAARLSLAPHLRAWRTLEWGKGLVGAGGWRDGG